MVCCGLVPVLTYHFVVSIDVEALRRRVLHSGGLLGVMVSAFFGPLSTLDHTCGFN
jgi:hypothetical protein